MTRKYSLVIEGGPGSYSAYVPELPRVLATAQSLKEPHQPCGRSDSRLTGRSPYRFVVDVDAARDRSRTAHVARSAVSAVSPSACVFHEPRAFIGRNRARHAEPEPNQRIRAFSVQVDAQVGCDLLA
jgi:hypothetical protein